MYFLQFLILNKKIILVRYKDLCNKIRLLRCLPVNLTHVKDITRAHVWNRKDSGRFASRPSMIRYFC